MSHFTGAFDPDQRRDAVAQVKSQLSVRAEIGGAGVVTPAPMACGATVCHRGPSRGPRGRLRSAAGIVRRPGRARREGGVVISLEPLNRYEDHIINRFEQAASLIDEIGSPSFKIVADTYHTNIEEADPLAVPAAVGDRLAHVQVSDSNRLESG